jgi:eukaryotic-like serine/threonine-protein kinase
LMAQPFDPVRLALGGEAMRVADQIGTGAGGTASYGFFSVSNGQALVYRRNQSVTASIVWTSRTGQEATSIATDVDRPSNPKLSPDGRKLAAIVAGDLWVYDLEGRPPIRLTFGGAHYSPLWTPDGRRLAQETGSVVTAVAADGSGGSPEAMSPPDGHFHPHGWSHDGREIILVRMQGPTRSSDIVKYSWQEKGEPQSVVSTDAEEGANGAALSPDGEWLAYVSDETGRPEIWVRPYLRAGPAIRLSANGGSEPVWAKNGHELYYLEQNKMMSVAVSAGSQFNFKPATLLFESHYQHGGQPPTYDVAKDGRFLMIKTANPLLSSFNVLLNWNPSVPPASH